MWGEIQPTLGDFMQGEIQPIQGDYIKSFVYENFFI